MTAFRAFDLDADSLLCFEEFAFHLNQKFGASEAFVDAVWDELVPPDEGFCRFAEFGKVFFPKAEAARRVGGVVFPKGEAARRVGGVVEVWVGVDLSQRRGGQEGGRGC